MSPRFDIITFLSDFGRDDIFVGVCHGVMAARAPHGRIVDLSHEVDRGEVAHGAALLARAVAYFPPSVHLAVVDPGVGTERRGIAVATDRGDVLVGPDNGLLMDAADEVGGVRAAYELVDSEHRLASVSATFHGRDVFSPAAADLAAGIDITQLGPSVTDPVRLDEPTATVKDDRLVAEIVLVDRFGNLQLAASPDTARAIGLRPGVDTRVDAGQTTAPAPFVATFGDLGEGRLGLYEDSDGRLALAVTGGSAALRLGLARGDRVTLRPRQAASVGEDS